MSSRSLTSASPSPGRRPAAQVVDISDVLEIPGPVVARVQRVRRGDVAAPDAIACVVLDGAILSRFVVGPRAAAQLLGVGDVFTAEPGGPNGPFRRDRRALAPSAVAMIHPQDPMCSTPAALTAVIDAAARSAETLAQQHVVSQLGDLEARVSILLPLLAERWGVMSVQGILLPAFLTHSVFAELLGVRRPSFTTAAARLAADGRLVRCDDGRWLIGSNLDATDVGPPTLAEVPAGGRG